MRLLTCLLPLQERDEKHSLPEGGGGEEALRGVERRTAKTAGQRTAGRKPTAPPPDVPRWWQSAAPQRLARCQPAGERGSELVFHAKRNYFSLRGA